MDSSKYPVWVLWNFGYQCNMNCLHCYSRVEANKEHEKMTIQQAEHIASEIIKAKTLHVHFGGGEPLMREDFFPNALRLISSGLTVSLSTNGWFLDQGVADKIAENSISMVVLSIYGTDSNIHDSFVRCPGAFERLMKACTHLKSVGIKTKFVVILCRKTILEAVKIIRLASRLAIQQVQFYPLKIVGNASRQLDDLQLNADEWKKVYELVFEEAKCHTTLNIDFGLDNDPIVSNYLSRPFLPCPCGRFSVVIRPSGDISACSLAVKVIGNIHRQSLLDLWQNSPELLEIRRGRKSPCEFLLR